MEIINRSKKPVVVGRKRTKITIPPGKSHISYWAYRKNRTEIEEHPKLFLSLKSEVLSPKTKTKQNQKSQEQIEVMVSEEAAAQVVSEDIESKSGLEVPETSDAEIEKKKEELRNQDHRDSEAQSITKGN